MPVNYTGEMRQYDGLRRQVSDLAGRGGWRARNLAFGLFYTGYGAGPCLAGVPIETSVSNQAGCDGPQTIAEKLAPARDDANGGGASPVCKDNNVGKAPSVVFAASATWCTRQRHVQCWRI
jgi:hypothetical protein